MQGSTVETFNIPVGDRAKVATSHHEAHPDHRIFGIIMFLIAESMIFLGLFAAYGTFRLVAPEWPPEGTPEMELFLPGINTIILVSSSFVINRGNAAIKQNNVAEMRAWFAATAAMGAIFLCGQLYEYFHTGFGLTDNIFTSTFYVLTGFHGLHVAFGLLLILAVLIRSLKGDRYSSTYHFGPEAAEIYWHFVDIIWIVLFTILYLI